MKLDQLKSAALNAFNQRAKEYDLALSRNNSSILDAKTTKSNLPDHFWQPLHKAFIRREGARQLLEIIQEIEQSEQNKTKEKDKNNG